MVFVISKNFMVFVISKVFYGLCYFRRLRRVLVHRSIEMELFYYKNILKKTCCSADPVAPDAPDLLLLPHILRSMTNVASSPGAAAAPSATPAVVV